MLMTLIFGDFKFLSDLSAICGPDRVSAEVQILVSPVL